MGKASSAKKIARAARAGATTGPSERRELGFPLLVAGIIVAGFLLIGFARSTRDVKPAPTLQDHWHSAYGIFDCVTDGFLPMFTSTFDPDGIHSHQDSLIHVHPFNDGVTGDDATLDVFFDAMGASISEDAIVLDRNETLEAGVMCDGEPAIIQVQRWDRALDAESPSEIFTENLGKIRFEGEGEGYTIARAPAGATLPRPTHAFDALEAVLGQERDEGMEPRNTTDAPQDQDFLGGDETDTTTGDETDTTGDETGTTTGEEADTTTGG